MIADVFVPDNSIFINRELSWLDFNGRVLDEGKKASNPLFERLRFVAIFCSNLDEFFMIRVGTLMDQLLIPDHISDNKTGLSTEQQIESVLESTRALLIKKDDIFKSLQKKFAKAGFQRIDADKLDGKQLKYWRDYFAKEIMPLLSPQVIDKHHPYPFVKNLDQYVCLHLETKNGATHFGIVPVTTQAGRLVFAPDDPRSYILIEDLIYRFAEDVFKKFKLVEKVLFRVTRNADINLDEGVVDYSLDYVDAMAELLRRRRRLSPVRLQLSHDIGQPLKEHLLGALGLPAGHVFIEASPLDLAYLNELVDSAKTGAYREYFYPRLDAVRPRDVRYAYEAAQQKDLMFYFPYESFKSITDMIDCAADDPTVVSIKMTLYRVARDSRVVESLIRAAENGKDVMAVIELRARFDEENNIEWARQLEEAGCTVIYGLGDYKVHAKLLLITKKSGSRVSYLSYVGTGNFNEKTATLYTDIGIVTARSALAESLGEVFRSIAMTQLPEGIDNLMVAPLEFKSRILDYIDREIGFAKLKQPAEITLKCNAVSDRDLIMKLSEASMAGVKVTMIVRGICCLKSGLSGKTDNIEVVSIVGRYLEHSRIFVFGPASRQIVYISSGDFLTRNTERRIEVALRVDDARIKQRLLETLELAKADTVNARIQLSDGSYKDKKSVRGQPPFNSQQALFAYFNEIDEQEFKSKAAGLKNWFRRRK